MAGEAKLWDFLRVRMPKGIHYSRIESETSPGFPDVHYTLQGHSGTLELKSEPEPKGAYPFADSMRKSQLDWITDEIAAGGHVTLVLQHRKDIYFLGGHNAPHLIGLTIDDINEIAEMVWGEKSPISIPAFSALLLNL